MTQEKNFAMPFRRLSASASSGSKQGIPTYPPTYSYIRIRSIPYEVQTYPYLQTDLFLIKYRSVSTYG